MASSSCFDSMNTQKDNWCQMQVLLHQTISLALHQVADQVISPAATWLALAAMMTFHCGTMLYSCHNLLSTSKFLQHL